jgi:hypothetical protein
VLYQGRIQPAVYLGWHYIHALILTIADAPRFVCCGGMCHHPRHHAAAVPVFFCLLRNPSNLVNKPSLFNPIGESRCGNRLQGPTETPAAETYAAISRKNIELLYLRRGLLESLVDSPDFERAVLGGFVRIRTQAIDNPNKAAYRLVPVIGKKLADKQRRVASWV